MSVDMDTVERLSPAEWVNHGNSPSTRVRRQYLLKYWVESNGWSSPEEGLSQNGIYRSVNRCIEFLQARGFAVGSVSLYRSCFPDFISACTGSFDPAKFNSLVRRVEGYTTTAKGCPSVEQVKEMLVRAGSASHKALISFLATTGWRIGEALSRRWVDIDFSLSPPRVKIEAKGTKKRYARVAFLCRELVSLLQYHKAELARLGVVSEWVWPGRNPANYVVQTGQYLVLKSLFEKVGLKDSEGTTYSPHSLRSFAENRYASLGLPEKYSDLILGHRTLKTVHYGGGNWDEVGQAWLKVESGLNYLNPSPSAKGIKDAVLAVLKDNPALIAEIVAMSGPAWRGRPSAKSGH